MNKKHSLLVFIFAIFIWHEVALAGEGWNNTPQGLPLDIGQLSGLNWHDKTAIERITGNWWPFTGEQGFEDRTILKKRDFILLGVSFSATLRLYKESNAYEILLETTTEERPAPKKFNELQTFFREKLGPPSKAIDLSDEIDKGFAKVYILIDWICGPTRIRLEVFSQSMYGKWISPVPCTVTISGRADTEDLQDLIILQFEATEEKPLGFGKDAKASKLRPFILIVDLNSKMLFRRDKGYIGRVVQSNEDFIVAEWENKDATNRLEIDRRLGTFSWRIRSKERKDYGADIFGTCNRMEAIPEKRF